jgi:hypothetical protein
VASTPQLTFAAGEHTSVETDEFTKRPRLERTAAWSERRIAVSDFRNVAEPRA